MNGVRDLILSHLDTKYAKTDSKNGIKMKNWVRNTWVAKKSTVNPEKPTQKVNSQLPKSQHKKSTVNARSMGWCGDDVVLIGTRADMAQWQGDTWQRQGACHVWHVTRRDGGQNLQAARGGAYDVGWRRFLCGWVWCEKIYGGGGVSIGGLEQKVQWRQWVFGDGFNPWRQQAHRNSNSDGGAIPKMAEAAEEC